MALVKVALRREEGWPVGVQAPLYFVCPCGNNVPLYDRHGNRVDADPDHHSTCKACGQRIDYHGYLIPKDGA